MERNKRSASLNNPFFMEEPAPISQSASYVRSKPREPNTDYLQDPLANLGIANDESLHHPSVFFDYLKTTKQQHDKIMENYSFFAEFRMPPRPLISDTQDDAKFRRTVMHSIQVIDQEKSKSEPLLITVEGFDDSSDWVSEDANDHIWKAIQNSTVPKAKKKKKPKKKKKKGQKPDVTEDLMTPEEASLDYQIAIAEERLKRHLWEYKAASQHKQYLQEQITKTRKRYDNEAQAIKSEQAQDDADLIAMEKLWSSKILAVEKEIETLNNETEATTVRLRHQITETVNEADNLKKEVKMWESFRDGPMVQNATTLERLTNSIDAQKKDTERYLALTDELIVLSEDFATESEKKALNDLCVQHVNTVREKIPPDELQGIEDNDILTAELTTLDKIYDDLLLETDILQKKILHQTAGAQVLQASIYESSAHLAKTTLSHISAETDDMKKKQLFEKTAEQLKEMDCVKARSGGLCIVGTSIFRKNTLLAVTASQTQPVQDVRSGFLTVPSVNKSATSAASISDFHLPESDIIRTVETVTSVERGVREEDPLQNYSKPAFLDEILHEM